GGRGRVPKVSPCPQECRALRNFSSLHAIVSALQSSPVHRLKRTWNETSREAQRSYEELSAICSEQDNYSASRQLLFQGVVPYLGTFLRDLVMLDAAMKDELENGYINFEKRRKVPPPCPLCHLCHPMLLTSVGTPSVTWEQPRVPPEATAVTPPSPGHLLSRLAQ
ncbi:PREDICTED: ral guanine nucleotide dissociation stimulator-like 2, partial [Tinamus guttatus]|uniref:ral guanine nucleotide dissociation stimulator-like 2 n=1 Tax=Tinamus guttatus TaxID=94827 RepID=UPI00052F12AF